MIVLMWWASLTIAMMLGYFMGHSFGYNKGFDVGYITAKGEARQ